MVVRHVGSVEVLHHVGHTEREEEDVGLVGVIGAERVLVVLDLVDDMSLDRVDVAARTSVDHGDLAFRVRPYLESPLHFGVAPKLCHRNSYSSQSSYVYTYKIDNMFIYFHVS